MSEIHSSSKPWDLDLWPKTASLTRAWLDALPGLVAQLRSLTTRAGWEALAASATTFVLRLVAPDALRPVRIRREPYLPRHAVKGVDSPDAPLPYFDPHRPATIDRDSLSIWP
jgi:hypothetical protein